ncbi:hypothetical protein [Sandarakinorhabdus sp.]|uniref:hypothetical protein n=1 Tax=Sandarakinorhabdus sp. TaxID=1916663 RepID=UPI003F72E832
MHNGLKLLAGVAATLVVARGGVMHRGQNLIAALSGAAADAVEASGVTDGSVSFRAPNGMVGRVARVSGTADAATRARVLNHLRQHPGIAGALWVERTAP